MKPKISLWYLIKTLPKASKYPFKNTFYTFLCQLKDVTTFYKTSQTYDPGTGEFLPTVEQSQDHQIFLFKKHNQLKSTKINKSILLKFLRKHKKIECFQNLLFEGNLTFTFTFRMSGLSEEKG